MTKRTVSTDIEIHDMLDRGRYREAAEACRNSGNPTLGSWALLLQGKLTEAMALAKKAENAPGQTMASACVYQLYSNDVGKPMVNALCWMEQSLIFWDKLLSADPENKDVLARRDFAKERKAWYYAHLETDKYALAHRSGIEISS